MSGPSCPPAQRPPTPQRPHGAGPAPRSSLPQERRSPRGDAPKGGLLGGPRPPFLRPGLGNTRSLCVSAARGPGPDSPPAARPSGPLLGGALLSSRVLGCCSAPTSGSAGTVPALPCYCEQAPPGDEGGVPAGFPALPGHGPSPLGPVSPCLASISGPVSLPITLLNQTSRERLWPWSGAEKEQRDTARLGS